MWRVILRALLLCGVLTTSVDASTRQVLLNGSNSGSTLIGSAILYAPMLSSGSTAGGVTWSSVEVNRINPWPRAGTLRNLFVTITAQPGASKQYAFTVRINAAGSALTCTIANTATTCQDTTHIIAIAAEDRVAFESAPTGTPATVSAQWSADWVPTVTNETVMGTTTGSAPSTAATNYNYPMSAVAWNAAATDVTTLNGLTGTITAIVARIATAPGAAKSWTFNVFLNGVSQSTSCVISGASAVTCNQAISIAIVPGDTLSIEAVPSASAPAAPGANAVSLAITTTTPGEFLITGASSDNPTLNATEYNRVSMATDTAWNATESTAIIQGALTPVTFRALRVNEYSGAPGVGQSYALTFRKNTAAGANTCTIADAATTCNDSTHSDLVISTDTFDLQIVASLAAALGKFQWCIVGYVPPCTSRMTLNGAGC